jgi:hypothetical protein
MSGFLASDEQEEVDKLLAELNDYARWLWQRTKEEKNPVALSSLCTLGASLQARIGALETRQTLLLDRKNQPGKAGALPVDPPRAQFWFMNVNLLVVRAQQLSSSQLTVCGVNFQDHLKCTTKM